MFDSYGYWFWIGSIFSLLLLSRRALPHTNDVLRWVGFLADQSMALKRPGTLLSALTISIWIMMQFFLSSMYKSVLITQLTKPREPKQIDSLQDLLDTFTDTNLAVVGPSVIQGHLEQSPVFPKLADGLKVFPFHDVYGSVEAVRKRQVALTFSVKSFLSRRIVQYNLMSGCKLYEDDFHISRETIGRMLLAPIIRKGYNGSQAVRNVLLTLFEAGLDSDKSSAFDYHKIANTDESCKAKEDVSRNDGPRGACIHKIEDQRLSFDDIKQVVYLYVTGMAFSLLSARSSVFRTLA